MHTFTYGVICKIFNVATYGVLGMEVIGEENIPEKGPFLVVCNHASNFDPLLLGTAMRHHLIHFMAKEELFRNPLMGWFLRYVHTFPVHRGHIDRKAVIESFRVLKSGEVLGIFPEGKRTRGGKVGPFHEGFAGIAIKAKVPVLRQFGIFAEKDRSRPGHLWQTRPGTAGKGIGSRLGQRFFRRNPRYYHSYAKSV